MMWRVVTSSSSRVVCSGAAASATSESPRAAAAAAVAVEAAAESALGRPTSMADDAPSEALVSSLPAPARARNIHVTGVSEWRRPFLRQAILA